MDNTSLRHLSDLPNGESAVIAKVKGYGAFRKRITEMGFVTGTKVKAIKKAPLQDPSEYELMGYRVSLRRSEARMIEIVCEEDAGCLDAPVYAGMLPADEYCHQIAIKGKTIQVALVGNPNSGKTSLFNHATGKHERVGNYGGVTVDIKTAHLVQGGYRINLVDLPGTYSISEYTPEELFVRKFLSEQNPDVVINVVDGSNLERNLFLTTQLIDMNVKVVIALNMHDELEKKGDKFDYKTLGKMLGIPIIPTVAAKGKGIGTLIDKVIDSYEENDPSFRHFHINYGPEISQSINSIKTEIKKNPELTDRFHSQYVAIKLIEGDKEFTDQVAQIPGTANVLEIAEKERTRLEKEYKESPETIVADAKYAFIRGALRETYHPGKKEGRRNQYRIDDILTNRWLGIPIFLVIMWLMFQTTFTLGAYPMDWIEAGVGWISEWLQAHMAEGVFRDLLVDGIIAGVGGVIVFLPNILILFLFISLMEDTGYMARAAFIMDKAMQRIGLHGKSFIPMLMGFGCNVPAIMATRTLESRKDRIMTMLVIPFMSCSARLPVYVLFISAFFVKYQGLVLLSVYAVGVVIAALTALIFQKFVFRKQDIPFVMELPPYRVPTLRNTAIHTWNKSVQYLQKMGTVILVASIIIWALGYFPRNVDYTQDYDAQIAMIEETPYLPEEETEEMVKELLIAQESERIEQSYIGRFGHFIEPAIRPLGYDWKIGVSLITGFAAKEIVVSSMGVLYQSDLEADENSVNLQTKLQEQTFTYGKHAGEKVFTPLVAYSLMLFILIYFPCVAVIAAIRREAGWKWALFSVLYTTALAWIVAFLIYQIGSMF